MANGAEVNFPDGGNPEYETEPVNRLMTGVLYGGQYGWEESEERMADWPKNQLGEPEPKSLANFCTTLQNNCNRENTAMKIDVTVTGGGENGEPVECTVYIYLWDSNANDWEQTYVEEGVTLTSLEYIGLQSHWGSGVEFSNAYFTKK